MCAMDCSTQLDNGCVYLKVSGDIDLNRMVHKFEIAMFLCSEQEDSRLFVDLCEVEDGITETYNVLGGTTGADIFTSRFEPINKALRIAVLGQECNVRKNNFQDTQGTDKLRAAGANTLYTCDRDEAVRWVA